MHRLGWQGGARHTGARDLHGPEQAHCKAVPLLTDPFLIQYSMRCKGFTVL